MSKTAKPAPGGPVETLPVLPLRDIVVFPHMIVPLFVGREKSIKALEEVMREDKRILLVAQKNPADDDPAADAIFEVGTLAQVLQLLKLPDGTVKVLVEGTERARVHAFTSRADFFEGDDLVDAVGAAFQFLGREDRRQDAGGLGQAQQQRIARVGDLVVEQHRHQARLGLQSQRKRNPSGW